MVRYAYFKCFMYQKPSQSKPTLRCVIVLEEPEKYMKGIDLQYLSLAEAHEIIRDIPGNFRLGNRGAMSALKMYSNAVNACRCFRWDRITEEL